MTISLKKILENYNIQIPIYKECLNIKFSEKYLNSKIIRNKNNIEIIREDNISMKIKTLENVSEIYEGCSDSINYRSKIDYFGKFHTYVNYKELSEEFDLNFIINPIYEKVPYDSELISGYFEYLTDRVKIIKSTGYGKAHCLSFIKINNTMKVNINDFYYTYGLDGPMSGSVYNYDGVNVTF